MPSRCMREHARRNSWQASLMHRDLIEGSSQSSLHSSIIIVSISSHRERCTSDEQKEVSDSFVFFHRRFQCVHRRDWLNKIAVLQDCLQVYVCWLKEIEFSIALFYRPRSRIFLQLLRRNTKKKEWKKGRKAVDFLWLLLVDQDRLKQNNHRTQFAFLSFNRLYWMCMCRRIKDKQRNETQSKEFIQICLDLLSWMTTTRNCSSSSLTASVSAERTEHRQSRPYRVNTKVTDAHYLHWSSLDDDDVEVADAQQQYFLAAPDIRSWPSLDVSIWFWKSTQGSEREISMEFE